METRANYVRVGIFTLLVLALGFGFVYWAVFATSGTSRVPLLVRIQGSVTGLQQGSQVLFNGLPVGNVTHLRIDSNNPGVVIAATEVDPGIPIKESTQANIGFAGLTGQAFIELKGGGAADQNIISQAIEQGTVPVIRANPSDVTDILATARDIAERANDILGQFQNIVDDVGPSVQTTATHVARITDNVDQFTASLAANSGDIDNFLASLSQLAKTANTVAEGLPATIDQVQGILGAVDPQAVHRVVENVSAMSQNLRAQSENIGSVVDSVKTAASSVGQVGEVISRNTDGIDAFLSNLAPLSKQASDAVATLDTTLKSTNRVVAAVDPKQVSSTLESISSAAGNVSSLAETIGGNKERIDTVDRRGRERGPERRQDHRRPSPRAPIRSTSLWPISGRSPTTSARVTAKLDETVSGANKVIAAVDPQKLSSTLDAFSASATNVQSLTEFAEWAAGSDQLDHRQRIQRDAERRRDRCDDREAQAGDRPAAGEPRADRRRRAPGDEPPQRALPIRRSS